MNSSSITPSQPTVPTGEHPTAPTTVPVVMNFHGKAVLQEPIPNNVSTINIVAQITLPGEAVSSPATANRNNQEGIFIATATVERLIKGPIVTALTIATCQPIDNFLTKIHAGKPPKRALEQVFKKPYKGSSLKGTQNLVMNSALFVVKPTVDSSLKTAMPDAPHSREILSGIICGCFQAVVTAPFSCIYTRLVTQEKEHLPQTKAIEIYREIPSGKKTRTLWSGTGANAIRNGSFLSAYFPVKAAIIDVFQTIKQGEQFKENTPLKSESPSTAENAVAGLVAGGTASLVSLPFDILAKAQRISPKPISLQEAFLNTCRQSGVRGLFKGAPIAAGRMGPAGIALSLGDSWAKDIAQVISSDRKTT